MVPSACRSNRLLYGGPGDTLLNTGMYARTSPSRTARSAVCGADRYHVAPGHANDDQRATSLHYRLHADHPSGRYQRAPRDAAIVGRARQRQSSRNVEPGRVTTPIERTGGGVIASGPVLVVVACGEDDRPLQVMPSAERLTTIEIGAVEHVSGAGAPTSEEMSQAPCLASNPTLGSLALPAVPAGVELTVKLGRKPLAHVVPPSVEVAQPIFEEPPASTNRPTWNAATTVFP